MTSARYREDQAFRATVDVLVDVASANRLSCDDIVAVAEDAMGILERRSEAFANDVIEQLKRVIEQEARHGMS